MRLPLLTSLFVALVLAAGCGGEEESSSQAWVNDFCSAAADWRTSLEDTVSQFQSPTDLSADSVRGAIDDGLEATETFVDDVRALGRPETEAGQEAAAVVDSMTSDIQSIVDDLRANFESGGDSLPELVGKLSQASEQINQMGQELQGSLDELESNEDCAAARA